MNKQCKHIIWHKPRTIAALWILLILLFAWNLGGTLLWQGIRHIHYSERQKEPCRDTIRIANTELHDQKLVTWMKQDEIYYRGRMFDIKRKISQGDHTILIGHYDKNDDKLFKWLAELFEHDDDTPDAKGKMLWSYEAIMPVTFSFEKYFDVFIAPTSLYKISTITPATFIPPCPPPEYC